MGFFSLFLKKNFKVIIIKKFYALLLFITILLMTSVSANYNYTQLGGSDVKYNLGFGTFNTQSQVNCPDDCGTTVVSDLRNLPLIADLDSDGHNELVALKSNSLRVYSVSEDLLFTQESAITTNFTSSDRLYYQLYNIDGDQYTEILVSGSTNDLLYIYEYNGSLIQQNALNFDANFPSPQDHTDGWTMFRCRSTEDCLITFFNSEDGDVFNVYNYARGFNSTHMGDQKFILNMTSGTRRMGCFPKLRTIEIQDFDNDGENDKEFIYSFIEAEFDGTDDSVYVEYLDMDKSNLEVSQEHFLIINESSALYTGGVTTCTNYQIGNFFSSPFVYDINNNINDGLETVVGRNTDADSFKLFSYTKDGSKIDEYPEILQGDGIIVSNVFLADAFGDTGREDFCMMGYDFENQQVELLCASELTGDLFQSNIFEMDTDGLWNITFAVQNFESAVHSADMSRLTNPGLQTGYNKDEIISPYGVLELDYTDIDCPGFTCDLNLIFPAPKDQGIVYTVDYFKSGREDMIIQQEDNVWYIDDGYRNSQARIESYIINPCIDSQWKVNTTVSIQMVVSDSNDDPEDDVSGRIMFYNGQPFLQDTGWIGNSTSGTTFTGVFTANKTISQGKLKLLGKDIYHNDENVSIEIPFTVGTNGVEFGDCITSVNVGLPEPDRNESGNACTQNLDCQTGLFCVSGVCTAPADNQDNVIVNSVVGISSDFKIPLIVFTFLVICFIFWGVYSYGAREKWGNQEKAIVAGVFSLAWLFIAWHYELVPTSVVFTIVSVPIVIGIIIGAKKATHIGERLD